MKLVAIYRMTINFNGNYLYRKVKGYDKDGYDRDWYRNKIESEGGYIEDEFIVDFIEVPA